MNHPVPWVYQLSCGCDNRAPGRILAEPLLKPAYRGCASMKHQGTYRILDIWYDPEPAQ